MGTISRITKNMGALTLTDAITKISFFILIMYAARNLGVVDFGKFSFAYAFVMLFGVFSDFGLSTLAVREVAKNKDEVGMHQSKILFMSNEKIHSTGILLRLSEKCQN